MFGKTVQNGDSLNILILGGSQGAKIFGDKLPEKFVSLSKKLQYFYYLAEAP